MTEAIGGVSNSAFGNNSYEYFMKSVSAGPIKPHSEIGISEKISPDLSPTAAFETEKTAVLSDFEPKATIGHRGLPENLIETTDPTPEAGRARRVKTVTKNPAWNVFTDKFNKLASVWNRKLITRPLTLISGISAEISGYLVYMFMANRAAAAAMTNAGAPSAGSAAGNLRTLRYAGAAGLLANSLSLVEALPQTVFAVVQIVSTIKKGVKLRQEIAKTEQELGKISETTENKTETELKLKDTLAAQKAELSKLPTKGLIAGISGFMSTISLARGSMGIAMVALVSTTQGKAVAISALSHAASTLGIVSGAIGVCLGGVSLAISGRQALNTYQEIKGNDNKIEQLKTELEATDLPAGKKKLIELEIKLLSNKKLALKDNLKHTLVSCASNLMLTFAGVAGLLGAVGVITGPGVLIFGAVALTFVGLSASISTAHYFYRKKTDAALAEEQQKNQLTANNLDEAVKTVVQELKVNPSAFSDDEIIAMLPTWSNQEEQLALINSFRAGPEVFLRKHFESLVSSEI